jgi:hypothetical protein
MARVNLAATIADVWDEVNRTSPDPFRSAWLFDLVTGVRRSYREHLDMREVNYLGEVIPQIEREAQHSPARRSAFTAVEVSGLKGHIG